MTHPRLSTRIHQALVSSEKASCLPHTKKIEINDELDASIQSYGYTLDYLHEFIVSNWQKDDHSDGMHFGRHLFGQGSHVNAAYKTFLENAGEFADSSEKNTCRVLYDLLTSNRPYLEQMQAVAQHFGTYATKDSDNLRTIAKVKSSTDVSSLNRVRRDAIERLHAAAAVLSASSPQYESQVNSVKGAVPSINSPRQSNPSPSELISLTPTMLVHALELPFLVPGDSSDKSKKQYLPSISTKPNQPILLAANLEDETKKTEKIFSDNWIIDDGEDAEVDWGAAEWLVNPGFEDDVESWFKHIMVFAPTNNTTACAQNNIVKSSSTSNNFHTSAVDLNAMWLLSLCNCHLNGTSIDNNSCIQALEATQNIPKYHIAVYELAQQIHAICNSHDSSSVTSSSQDLAVIQDALFNLLGENGFELMMQLLADMPRVQSLDIAALLMPSPLTTISSSSASAQRQSGLGPVTSQRQIASPANEDEDAIIARELAMQDQASYQTSAGESSIFGSMDPAAWSEDNFSMDFPELGSVDGADIYAPYVDDATLSANQRRKMAKKRVQLLQQQQEQHARVAALLAQQTAGNKAIQQRSTGGYDPANANSTPSSSTTAIAGNALAYSTDWLRELGFSEEYLEQERALGLEKNKPRTLEDRWLDGLAPEGTTELQEKRGLPVGTTREVHKDFEEVHIPATKNKPMMSAEDHVPISSLPPWAQATFPGTEKLNTIQSTVFGTAYNTSENMLVCAPTGAGKTNIAMLTFLQLLKQHIDITGNGGQGSLDAESVKAVYIAPMKALAQEVVTKFSERLKPLGLVVREFTGDMQLTKAEIMSSQILVSTPEKYDVITRKGGDGSLITLVTLLIIDEVHLLADDRGAVLETIVARTQRYVESAQRPVRIIGLSATLPNYKDVAKFLGVNMRPGGGCYFFGPEYRPVPLDQTLIGITEKARVPAKKKMVEQAHRHMITALERGKQVMIFVHSRKETSSTAQALQELNAAMGTTSLFQNADHDAYTLFKRAVDKSHNRELQLLFASGMGVHHAGMLRADRSLTEQMFEAGLLRVLCCTATLAWGVNLPAHTVIIKGTELYDPERGGFVDLSILDVVQIFGRAGRPQYDTSGHAILITPHRSLNNYVRLLGHQAPIESSLIKALADHLNAEVVNGTVSNIREASTWLSYTFLFIRMRANPLAYGILPAELWEDPQLDKKRLQLIKEAAIALDQAMMLRYDEASGNLGVTDLGRIASHFYLKHTTITCFNNMLSPHLAELDALHVLCSSTEFDQLKVRPEEIAELDKLKKTVNLKPAKAASDDTPTKVSVLLQSYCSNIRVSAFTLQSDTNYVAQNSARITRALFEICLKRGWSVLARHYLELAKSIDRRMHFQDTPLRQFNELSPEVIKRIETVHATPDRLVEMGASDAGVLIHNHKEGSHVVYLAKRLPHLRVEATVQPITRGILKVRLELYVDFIWSARYHGMSEPFHVWIEDDRSESVYYSEYHICHRYPVGSSSSTNGGAIPHEVAQKQKAARHKNKDKRTDDEQEDAVHESAIDPSQCSIIEFTIPMREPLPSQYYVRCISDRWVGCETCTAVSFQHLLLPEVTPPHTPLLDIHPIPVSILELPAYRALFPHFTHFNAVQSQTFHALYHSDHSVLVGAPTGSGKTILAELALLRLRNMRPRAKAIYIAPMKALARERLLDWQTKLGKPQSAGGLGLTVLELTGDSSPDIKALRDANLLVVTPEKWDSISRGWQKQSRGYVRQVELVILDEIHLLGVDRGPVLEIIVSRMRFIAAQQGSQVRFLGLSTALANPRDLADWLGIGKIGVYNFRPSVRPVPMTIYIQGFPGKHYCPRMATMNKPCYAAILEHSPTKPALIFVSSRRQTRLTALDLISLCAADSEMPKRFLHMSEIEAAAAAESVRDSALRDTLVFGVAIHHAGLDAQDRALVENLYLSGKIQVLVCTATLAWGVNLPCHLVIVKGTEFFDGKLSRYVDMPVTDVLQMMGRAGRPQFDDHACAVVMAHEPKKHFYKRFLHEPFPVESSLHTEWHLHAYINAEAAAGTVVSLEACIELITYTYFFRRLACNPSYYQLLDTTPQGMYKYLLKLITQVCRELDNAKCIECVTAEGHPVYPVSDANTHIGGNSVSVSSNVSPTNGLNATSTQQTAKATPEFPLGFTIVSTPLGRIASYYYLHYLTVGLFQRQIQILTDIYVKENATSSALANKTLIQNLLRLVSDSYEFAELPVRHNEYVPTVA